ncbi:MAG TPA: hypothetical protein V6D48_19005 [Oculatellaceae cyanobacterium]
MNLIGLWKRSLHTQFCFATKSTELSMRSHISTLTHLLDVYI